MRFINDDVKLKNGGRNSVRISEDELWNKIVARARKIGDCYIDEDTEDNGPDGDEAAQFISELFYNDETIRKDIKYNVDGENILVACDADYEDKYIGMYTTNEGLTFYGFLAGGDWEMPMFIIIYWDGKKLRAYVPSYGNVINLDCKCAFGSECDEVDDNKAKALLAKYKKLGIEPEDPNDIDWGEMYCKIYDTTPDSCEFNYDAMLKDITARIIVS